MRLCIVLPTLGFVCRPSELTHALSFDSSSFCIVEVEHLEVHLRPLNRTFPRGEILNRGVKSLSTTFWSPAAITILACHFSLVSKQHCEVSESMRNCRDPNFGCSIRRCGEISDGGGFEFAWRD